jgi:hypothetical protein
MAVRFSLSVPFDQIDNSLAWNQGSSGRTRTCNPPVNSRLLCRLSYRGKRRDYNHRMGVRQGKTLVEAPRRAIMCP